MSQLYASVNSGVMIIYNHMVWGRNRVIYFKHKIDLTMIYQIEV